MEVTCEKRWGRQRKMGEGDGTSREHQEREAARESVLPSNLPTFR